MSPRSRPPGTGGLRGRRRPALFLSCHRGSFEVSSPCCALCRAEFREGEEIITLPDFLADDTHPFYPYSGATVHRACYLFWDQRKAFAAAYNRIARTLGRETGVYPHLTSEGDLELRPVHVPETPSELRFPH